jgi:hypothetical protein
MRVDATTLDSRGASHRCLASRRRCVDDDDGVRVERVDEFG